LDWQKEFQKVGISYFAKQQKNSKSGDKKVKFRIGIFPIDVQPTRNVAMNSRGARRRRC
jgi:hypothetical protein